MIQLSSRGVFLPAGHFCGSGNDPRFRGGRHTGKAKQNEKIKKIIIWVLAAGLTVFIALSIIVSLFARKIVISQIEKNLKMEASLDSIGLRFPFFVSLNNLKIGDFFAAKNISFYPNVLGFFSARIVLGGLTITGPVINLEQSKDGRLNLPELEQKGKQVPVFLTGLNIKNGRLIFTDKKITPKGHKTIIDKINVRISKVILPLTSLNAGFNCDGKVVDLSSAVLGDINFSGWIDFIKKDMDAVLEIADLDALYFYPYYEDLIAGRKLVSARLNFKSRLKAENNDLTAVCNLRVSDLAYARQEQSPENELLSFDLAGNVLDLFSDKQGNLNLDWTVKTKLDQPKIRITDLKGVVLRPQEVIDKVSDTVEEFKAIGRKMKEMFRKE